ncbi:MAG TPA: TetR/AcrR family transcriptional regulator [Ilumatobacteraceae bacterium]|nr:TetR/AcrR family transcriptional regulator [Ilumatobacteraceae bacterium]
MSPIDTTAPPRPAHRPSRRQAVVDGAMGLFATMPVDEVTVQDIANAVDMTAAAVYYHFASKEQILTEGMQQFGDQLLHEIRAHVPEPGQRDGLATLLTHVMSWTIKRRPQATVYFVNSIGLNLMVEALRRETRVQMVEQLQVAVKSVRGRLGAPEAGVIAVALVSLLETSLASILNQDAVYRGLGAKRSIAEVAAVGERIAGLD